MGYVSKWSNFRAAAKELFLASPQKTRFQVKVRKCKGSAIVKVTNDEVCLKYKVRHVTEGKKVEKLTSQMLSMMSITDTELAVQSASPETPVAAAKSQKK
eukprot:GHVN01024721.1.p2 GENE.GHVN01024721.1~~GHVN01024721.1.p2  ORF type:complete len:100 (+),score=22.15 GHVN01024721.1:526-825(+)